MLLKVYVLDDESDICQIFKENFTTSEIEIHTFVDPKYLLEAINRAPPDLIFLDYRLPNTNGVEVAKLITSSTPIILLSGDLDVTVSPRFHKKFNKQPFPWIEIEHYLNEQLNWKKNAS